MRAWNAGGGVGDHVRDAGEQQSGGHTASSQPARHERREVETRVCVCGGCVSRGHAVRNTEYAGRTHQNGADTPRGHTRARTDARAQPPRPCQSSFSSVVSVLEACPSRQTGHPCLRSYRQRRQTLWRSQSCGYNGVVVVGDHRLYVQYGANVTAKDLMPVVDVEMVLYVNPKWRKRALEPSREYACCGKIRLRPSCVLGAPGALAAISASSSGSAWRAARATRGWPARRRGSARSARRGVRE